MLWFFFFKQMTAYELRISDWSSDVCSSDLQQRDLWPYERPIFSDQPRRHDESFDALWLGRSPGEARTVRIRRGCALRRARLRRADGVADCPAGGAREFGTATYRENVRHSVDTQLSAGL